MRIHVVGWPNFSTTEEFVWAPYAQKVRRLCDMLYDSGNEVYLYGTEANEARCTEHIVCITKKEREEGFPQRWPPFDIKAPIRVKFMNRVTQGIKDRLGPNDLICCNEGVMDQPLALQFPKTKLVEVGISYEATFAKYRIFESHSWMHAVYGMVEGAHRALVSQWDTVIHPCYHTYEFPEGHGEDDYVLYMGRINSRKGIYVVDQAVKQAGLRLVVAGEIQDASVPEDAEYLGVVFAKDRANIMGRARCLIAPTQNMEPFGGVVAEAQMCGTPAITTDWGSFVETVEHGRSGFRCRTIDEFAAALDKVTEIDRGYVRQRAHDLFSSEKVAPQYNYYLGQVLSDTSI